MAQHLLMVMFLVLFLLYQLSPRSVDILLQAAVTVIDLNALVLSVLASLTLLDLCLLRLTIRRFRRGQLLLD
jgi:hypothetical protein